MKTYYIAKPDGTQIGPLSVESVAKLRLHGKISNDSLIWSEGMAEWQPLETVFPSRYVPTGSWNMVNALTHSFKNFGNIAGRASRAVYWLFQLNICLFYLLIICLLVLCAGSETGLTICTAILILGVLVLLIPSITISIRRLHDVGMSGWFLLINLIPSIGGIIFFIFTVLPSQPANQYGIGPHLPIDR
jgi:uncharacterized membrane protein YhaH (DUF805 family)